MTAVTVSPILVKQMLEGVENRGFSREELLASQGITPKLLSSDKIRISVPALGNLCKAIIDLLNDETLGLTNKTMPLGAFQFLFQACQAAITVRESLEIFANGLNLLDRGLSASFTDNEEAGLFCLEADHDGRSDCNYIHVHMLSSIHRFLCWQINDFLPIKRVDFDYPAPDYADEYKFNFYGSPIYFEQNRTALHFADSELQRKCIRSNQDLVDLSKDYISLLILQSRQSQMASVKVRQWMERTLLEGVDTPDIKMASANLGISEHALRRRLKAENYPFNKLKEDTRRDLAIFQLEEEKHSVEEIAFNLGFSEASTFIRSFKKWTGETPLAYRKLLRAKFGE